MPLPQPREGESLGFNIYPSVSEEGTLGGPESLVWASILHLRSRGVAEQVAGEIHGVRRKRDKEAVVKNLKVYIQQASEFYQAARIAKPNTAPLFYYYSFLNLAKAYCELKNPRLHERNESYRHGVSWRPNRRSLVNMKNEQVSVTTRGVWHLLWEAFVGTPCPAPNPTHLKIRDLFSYCPELGIEYERTYVSDLKLVDLEKPDVLYDDSTKEAWIRFSINRADLKYCRISAPMLLRQIQSIRTGYTEVKAAGSDYRTFQSTIPAKIDKNQDVFEIIQHDIDAFNAFVLFGLKQKLEYSIPIQAKLPIRMPQIMVLYTILFWLGSLVRYDPHSLYALMDSRYWILIDGFMSQSRLWLIDLFEWALYQTETTLRSTR